MQSINLHDMDVNRICNESSLPLYSPVQSFIKHSTKLCLADGTRMKKSNNKIQDTQLLQSEKLHYFI